MLPKFKAAMFDMDGTLTHTMRYWRIAPLEFAIKYDVIPTPEEYARLFTQASCKSIVEICENHGISYDEAEINRELEEFVHHHYLYDARAKEDIERFLDLLDARGIPACVATGAPRRNALDLLTRLGLTDRFTFIMGGYDHTLTKRSPEYFRMIAERMGVEPKELCVFEDALYAIRAAKEAGCSVVAIAEPLQGNDREAIIALSDVYAGGYAELCGSARVV